MKKIPAKYVVFFLLGSLSLAMFLPISQAKPDIRVKVVEVAAPSSGGISPLERNLESLVAQIEKSSGVVRNVSVLNSRHPDKLLCVITYEVR